jgi:hypothetical protein
MSPSIGFDFDECLVQAYTMVPFVLLFEILLPRATRVPGVSKDIKFYIEKARSVFYQRVANNEIKTKGTLFRPSLLKLMPKLVKLRQEGKINRLFIYSNNGINELLNVVDHILALTLRKAPYSINDEELLKEADGLHVLGPRIHIDNPCRISTEPKGADGFREKTLSGIQGCLGESILEKDLWFLDDTEYHKNLMEHLKGNYIVVESYPVHLSNKVLAEMFIDSFPLEFLLPPSPVALTLLSEINRIMPGFRPGIKETKKTLIEKLGKVLNKFSEPGAGRAMAVWKEDHVNKDLQKIEQKLSGAINQPVNYSSTYTPPIGGALAYSAPLKGACASAYSAPLKGARQRAILPVSSRLRKTRKLRKDLK